MVMIGKPTIGRGLAVAALFVAGVTATQSPASARDNGAAIGLGVLAQI